MSKQVFGDYLEEIEHQREAWQRKPQLRILYRHWYAEVVAALSPLRPVMEIGAGCGNFKEYFPDVIATDIFRSGPWIDRVMDAHDLQLAPFEVGNLVAFDVIHHLQRPLNFLRQASAALVPGGRLVLCEPAVTVWSRFVYRRFHHEPIEPDWDLFGADSTPPLPDPGHTFANMGIAEILFCRHLARTLDLLPSFKLISVRKFGFLVYPLIGGFGYRSFLPRCGLKALLRAEDILLRPAASKLTGMRMLVVLEKRTDEQANSSAL